jgi:hypothetical protein
MENKSLSEKEILHLVFEKDDFADLHEEDCSDEEYIEEGVVADDKISTHHEENNSEDENVELA